MVHARSKIAPKNGGGDGPGFTWEQTPTDVTIMFEVRGAMCVLTMCSYCGALWCCCAHHLSLHMHAVQSKCTHAPAMSR